MKNFIWRLRATLAYRRIAGLDLRMAWGCAGALLENFRDDQSPADAVREDLSYWGD